MTGGVHLILGTEGLLHSAGNTEERRSIPQPHALFHTLPWYSTHSVPFHVIISG